MSEKQKPNFFSSFLDRAQKGATFLSEMVAAEMEWVKKEVEPIVEALADSLSGKVNEPSRRPADETQRSIEINSSCFGCPPNKAYLRNVGGRFLQFDYIDDRFDETWSQTQPNAKRFSGKKQALIKCFGVKATTPEISEWSEETGHLLGTIDDALPPTSNLLYRHRPEKDKPIVLLGSCVVDSDGKRLVAVLSDVDGMVRIDLMPLATANWPKEYSFLLIEAAKENRQ